MPSSPQDSIDSQTPSGTPSAEGQPAPASPARPAAWRLHVALFLATVASAFVTSLGQGRTLREELLHAAQYTAALMTILLCHEFGHYVAARLHKVDASLPFFIPLPFLSPFGTMGAVIRMRDPIRTRRALLDIGAAGPLAGLVVAVPLYAWGVAHSHLVALDSSSYGVELGNSLLLRALDHLFGPAVPPGMDILLSPVAFAAWAGMFVTMINLLPVGQLDGGHVAYALFGPRQNGIGRWVHRSTLVFFFVSVASSVARDARAGMPGSFVAFEPGVWHLGRHVNDALFWLVWFEVLAVLGAVSSHGRPGRGDADTPQLAQGTRIFGTLGLVLLAGMLRDKSSPVLWGSWFVGLAVLLVMESRWGALGPTSDLLDHPATGPERLGLGRSVVAAFTLALFAALFMPTPLSL
jgi:Zn-dependent protease